MEEVKQPVSKLKIVLAILDIIVICLIVWAFWDFHKNIELFKILNSDVCQLCMNQTGKACMDYTGLTFGS